jgi:hypothetical protein
MAAHIVTFLQRWHVISVQILVRVFIYIESYLESYSFVTIKFQKKYSSCYEACSFSRSLWALISAVFLKSLDELTSFSSLRAWYLFGACIGFSKTQLRHRLYLILERFTLNTTAATFASEHVLSSLWFVFNKNGCSSSNDE